MRASTCVPYVCLAVENHPSNRLGGASTDPLRPVANRLCWIPLYQPSLLPTYDALTNIQNP